MSSELAPFVADEKAVAEFRHFNQLPEIRSYVSEHYEALLASREAQLAAANHELGIRCACRFNAPTETAECAEHARIRQQRDEAQLEHQCSEGVLSMTVARLGGKVEGRPTGRRNFLQRIDELRAIERAAKEPPQRALEWGMAREIEALQVKLSDTDRRRDHAEKCAVTLSTKLGTAEERLRAHEGCIQEITDGHDEILRVLDEKFLVLERKLRAVGRLADEFHECRDRISWLAKGHAGGLRQAYDLCGQLLWKALGGGCHFLGENP